MSKPILVSNTDFGRLCRIAQVLKRQNGGKMPTFAEVIKHILDHYAT